MKNYVFGDTGGHLKQLYASLRAIGVDPTNGTMPKDVRVIHLGDLIHKGPHSSLLLEQIDKLIRNNPGQWIQILGNHEFQHIEGSPYFWKCDCNKVDVAIINEWHEQGLATPTFGIDSYIEESIVLGVSKRDDIPRPKTGMFFSHAGLSWEWWAGFEKLTTPSELSDMLNSISVSFITTPGEMLGVYGRKPGPVWAIGNSEVFDGWTSHADTMPFLQMHGHTTSYNWMSNKWWRNDRNFQHFRNSTKLNPETRAVITKMSGNLLIGIDPGYSKNPTSKEQPYVYFETK